jgi:hypothetical protein
MIPVNSRFELSHAPELRNPGAEALGAEPARYTPHVLADLPAGVSPADVRRVAYLNFAHDPCTALLLGASDGLDYLLLNELGPDAYGEVEHAGRALAEALGVPYEEGPPSHWPTLPRSWLARLFGYAA